MNNEKHRRFTAAEKEFLRDFIPGHSHKETTEAFNEKFDYITTKQIKSYIGNNKLNTGKTGRFEKGHEPANKGQNMPNTVYEQCQPTMFKRGHVPINYDPIGTEKLLSDGYVWVKVDDKPKAPKKVNWTQKHRIIWERVNGKIPEGHTVLFADQDRNNFDLNNLILVSRAQLVRMNQSGLIWDDAEATKKGVLIADLITATSKAKRRTKRKRGNDRQ